MYKDRNDLNKENQGWKIINDAAEMDDLLNLALLRDLKRKFDESLESRFEKILSWDGYPDTDYE